MAEEHLASIDEETGHNVMDNNVLAFAHWCQLPTSVRPNWQTGSPFATVRYRQHIEDAWRTSSSQSQCSLTNAETAFSI
jgi:hypothetical protein